MIEITESASRVINKQLQKQAKPGGGLRIAVKAGGCSGYSYTFAWDASANQYAHPTGVIVLTPKGQIARYLFGIEYAPKDLRWSLVEASQGRLGNVVDQLLLLCYHYDPKVGKYGPVAIGAMRTAGALTLVSLGAFVTVMIRRDNRRKRRADSRAK